LSTISKKIEKARKVLEPTARRGRKRATEWAKKFGRSL